MNKQVELNPDVDDNFWQWMVTNTVSKTHASDAGSVMTTRHTVKPTGKKWSPLRPRSWTQRQNLTARTQRGVSTSNAGTETTADVIKTWAVEVEQDWLDHNERAQEHPGEKLATNDIVRAAINKLIETCPELRTDHEFTAGVRNILDGKDPNNKGVNKQADLNPDNDDNFWQ